MKHQHVRRIVHFLKTMAALRLCLLLFGSLVWTAQDCVAAAPVNDSCAGALVVPGNGPFPHFTSVTDITGATTNVSDPPITNTFLASRVARSVWYRFTPTVTAL